MVYRYDEKHRLIETTLDSIDIKFTYDNDDHLTEVNEHTEALSRKTTYMYPSNVINEQSTEYNYGVLVGAPL